MTDLSTSAIHRQQCKPAERYRHKPTGKRYVLNMEAGGTCELESTDRRCTYATRKDLDNTEVWERLP